MDSVEEWKLDQAVLIAPVEQVKIEVKMKMKPSIS